MMKTRRINKPLQIILSHANPEIEIWLRQAMLSGEVLKWRHFGMKCYNEVAHTLGLQQYPSFGRAWKELRGNWP